MSTGPQPASAEYKSIKVTGLIPGETKYWCACGLSKNQPWCDGSHRGTGIKPLPFVVPELKEGERAETKEFSMCQCKRSNKKPFCDGTHRKAQAQVAEQIAICQKSGHEEKGANKLCTKCGYVPDF